MTVGTSRLNVIPRAVRCNSAPYAEWLALVAIALHVPGKLEWDGKTQHFTNNAEANKFVKPVFKKGWELKI